MTTMPKLVNLPTRSNMPWLEDNTILFVRAGSQSYGTSLPTSDTDYKGIAVAPREYYLGYLQRFEQAEYKTPYDAVIYDGMLVGSRNHLGLRHQRVQRLCRRGGGDDLSGDALTGQRVVQLAAFGP